MRNFLLLAWITNLFKGGFYAVLFRMIGIMIIIAILITCLNIGG